VERASIHLADTDEVIVAAMPLSPLLADTVEKVFFD
jgi:hypothetical protein